MRGGRRHSAGAALAFVGIIAEHLVPEGRREGGVGDNPPYGDLCPAVQVWRHRWDLSVVTVCGGLMIIKIECFTLEERIHLTI